MSGVGPPPGFMMIQLLATLTMAGFSSSTTRPPRIPADRQPHCAWTVIIDESYPEVEDHPVLDVVRRTRAARTELEPIDTDDDGLLEWVGRRSRFAKAYGVRIDLDDLEAIVSRHGGAARCVATGDRVHLALATFHEQSLSALAARMAALPGRVSTR